MDVADRSTDIARAQTSCGAATEQHYTREIRGTKRLVSLSVALGRCPMTSQAREGACAFAWRNYLLLHSGISETAVSARTIARVPPSIATSPIFVTPASMVSIS